MTYTISPIRADEMLSRGQIEDALWKLVNEGVQPYQSPALRMKAMLQMRKRDFPGAGNTLLELMTVLPDGNTHKMLGDWHFLQNQYEKCAVAYAKADSLWPDNMDIVHDLAVALNSQGKFAQSLPLFRRAVELAPDRADFHHHLGIILVSHGFQTEGWREMEWRMKVPGVTGTFPEPDKYWTGQDLNTKTIVVRAEQGMGDTIMFARYCDKLFQRGASRVIFYVQRILQRWGEVNYPLVKWWPNDAPPPRDFDYHVNTMSLPAHFFPDYVTPGAHDWGGNDVGLAWFGSPGHKADHLRTIALEEFAPVFESQPQMKFKCANYGRFEQPFDHMEYLIDECLDFADTQEKLKSLNLLITVDTAIAHLAATMGIQTWLLLPYVPDFRWGTTTDTTPWYESMKLYRQTRVLHWDDVILRVRDDLAKRLLTRAAADHAYAAPGEP